MPEFVELSNTAHKHLKVDPQSSIKFVEGQQIMRVRVAEVAQAATNFPIVFTRNGRDGSWVLSILTSLTQQHNSFVKNGEWQASFLPSTMQTHPLYLINSGKDENTYTIGIDEHSDAFSVDQGESLFDDKGAPTLYLSRIKARLEADIKRDMETFHFTQKLEQLALLKPIDLNIQLATGGAQKLAGLYVLDEAKLKQLSGEQLAELNGAGYLVPMHAMLISLFQMNTLINRNNAQNPENKVTKLKMEVAKDASFV